MSRPSLIDRRAVKQVDFDDEYEAPVDDENEVELAVRGGTGSGEAATGKGASRATRSARALATFPAEVDNRPTSDQWRTVTRIVGFSRGKLGHVTYLLVHCDALSSAPVWYKYGRDARRATQVAHFSTLWSRPTSRQAVTSTQSHDLPVHSIVLSIEMLIKM